MQSWRVQTLSTRKRDESVDRIMEKIAMERGEKMEDTSGSYVDVGGEIRLFRKSQGLTVQDLADKTGFSVAIITQIENRMISPPLGILVEISNVFNRPISSFLFDGEGKEFSIVRRGKKDSVSRVASKGSSSEDYRYESLGAGKKGRMMEPFLVTLKPRGAKQVKMSVHAGEEFIYVLAGRVEIRLDRYSEVLEEGDSIYFSSHIPHHVHTAEEGEASILAVIHQGKGDGI